LVKTKHAVLNKRSNSAKPKSVTFKEEEKLLLKPQPLQQQPLTQNSFEQLNEKPGSARREPNFQGSASSRNQRGEEVAMIESFKSPVSRKLEENDKSSKRHSSAKKQKQSSSIMMKHYAKPPKNSGTSGLGTQKNSITEYSQNSSPTKN